MNIVILLFAIISIFHFIYKNYKIDEETGEIDINKQTGFTTLRYAILMGIIIFILNVVNIGNKCSGNTTIIFHAFMSFIPWVFVFLVISVVFSAYPGWKAPFSNTFGYLFVRFMKANALIISLFNTIVEEGIDDENEEDDQNLSFNDKKNMINNIYKDQSIMLNVITLSNINSFWSSMFGNIEDAEQYKEELYKIIETKDKVSEFIWYILLSTIAYTISNRYIATIKCNKKVQELEAEAQATSELVNN